VFLLRLAREDPHAKITERKYIRRAEIQSNDSSASEAVKWIQTIGRSGQIDVCMLCLCHALLCRRVLLSTASISLRFESPSFEYSKVSFLFWYLLCRFGGMSPVSLPLLLHVFACLSTENSNAHKQKPIPHAVHIKTFFHSVTIRNRLKMPMPRGQKKTPNSLFPTIINLRQ
jgi:hypothetical protein